MKTDTKHTPGPWKAEGWESLVVNCAEGYTLTLAAGREGAGLEELKANAALIAAAPDLLAALEDIVKLADNTDFYLPLNWLEDARAAIAKAEGNK